MTGKTQHVLERDHAFAGGRLGLADLAEAVGALPA
jgi:hypothetical protein